MKKKFTFLIAALMLLTMISQPTRVCGQEKAAYNGTFTRISSADDFVTGYYVVTASRSASSNGGYALGDAVDGNKRITGVSVVIPTTGTNAYKLVNPDNAIVYYITKTTADNVTTCTFQNVNTGKYMYQSSTTSGKGMGFSDSSYDITLAGYNSTSPIGFRFTLNQSSTNFLKYNVGSKWFANYANAYSTSMTPVDLFRLYTHSLTYNNAPTGGTVTVKNGNSNVSTGSQVGEGATLNIVAAPISGYNFSGWTVTGGTVANANNASTTFTMGTTDATITANFISAGPTVSTDPASLNFGPVAVGTSPSPTRTVQITHANLSADLTLTVPTPGFTVSPASITQGTSSPTDVTVTFTPTAIQSYDGNLQISGGGLGSPINVPITASGTCSAPATALAYPDYELTLTGSSVSQTLTPTESTGNGGTITYAMNENPGSAGSVVAGTGVFTATATGNYVVTATQALNGTTCGDVVNITIVVNDTNPTCTIYPAAGHSFGKVLTNTSESFDFSVSFANLEHALTLSVPTGYSVTPSSIAANATSPVDVTVTFTPTAATTYNGNLSISGDDFGGSSITAALSGTGDAGYTVTFNPYSGTCTPTSIRVATGGSIAELPTATADGATFYGWATQKIASIPTAPTSSIVSAPYTPTGNVTLHAVYKIAKEFDNTAACAGSYTIYSVVETGDKATTNYYATGTLNKKYSSTTTASDAKSFTLTKVSGYGNDEWAIKDGDNYVAYSSSTDLTTQSGDYKWIITQGVKGTWRITAASTLNSTIRGFVFQAGTTNKFGGYAISNLTPGAAYYDIEFGGASFTYNSETPVAKPTYNLAGGSYAGEQSVTISCTTPGATIYYTTNGSDPTASSTEYTGAITVDETMTIKAIAMKSEMANSTVAYATYSIVPLLTTMDDIFEAASEIGGTADNVAVSFDNWVVSGIAGSDDQIVYVTDNDGKGFIIYKYTNGFAVNDKLSGTVAGTPLKLSEGSAEFTGLTTSAEGLTVTHDGTITPVAKTISQLTSGLNTGAVVTISNLTYNGSNLVDGSENTITPNTSLYSYGSALTSGHDYSSVTGVFVMYNSTKQIHPRSAADIVEVEYNIALNDVPSGCTIGTDGDIATAKYGQTVTLTQSAGAGYRFISWTVMNGVTPVAVTNNAFTMPKGAVTVTATFVPTYAITTSVTPANTGTVTADPNPAIEGETVTLTIEPEDGYALKSITAYKTGESSTPVTITENTITMPAYGVTVAAEFATEYSFTYNVNGGTGDAHVEKYGAGANVTVASIQDGWEWTAPTGKLFTKWTTNADGTGTEYQPDDVISEIADNYNLYAQWRDIVYHVSFSVNGIIDSERNVAYNTAIGALPEDPELAPLTFLGWSSTSATGATDITASWKPTGENENVTVYAVFGTASQNILTINPSDVPTAYPTSYTNDTISSVVFKLYNVATYDSGSTIQFKKNTSAGIYNYTDLNRIDSIKITYSSTPDITVRPNTSASSTSSESAITPKTYTNAKTFVFSGDYGYFLMTNGSSTTNLTSIVIYYQGISAMAYETISGSETKSEFTDDKGFVVPNGATLTFTGTNTSDPKKIIVKDGGQLIVYDNGAKDGVQATIEKNIAAWTTTPAAGGWYFIALPIVATDYNPSTAGLITDTYTGEDVSQRTYDLYKYVADHKVEEVSKPWVNYRAHTNDFVMANGQGYLYANASSQMLEFAGTVKPYSDSNNTVALAKTGWNLVGNPFTCNVTVDVAFSELNHGTAVSNQDAGSTIKPCTGIAVNGKAGDVVIFTMVEPEQSAAPSNPNLQMTLSQQATNRGNASVLDNAIVSFNEGSELPKFYFGTQNANIYIPMDNEEYAVVSSNAQGEMPVNFRAYETGEYTITVNPEEVEMGYLHLIDNIAGQDIDLLATPSYTFNARTDDYESRFRLVFSSNMANAEMGEDFAFFSNGQLVIANEGEAILQVIDVTGRVVATENINGTCSKAINAKAGVYVLRLINGTDVKTQKMVIR